MPDKQVHPIGTENAPADYTLPDSAELLLKSVYAKYDGSGASGDFVPLVRIVSDAGSITDEIPQDTTVAAGASADATWFPHVAAPAATAAVASPLIASAFNDGLGGDSPQSVGVGATASATFAHTTTPDASVISWDTITNPNDSVLLHAVGTYLLYVGAHFAISNPSVTAQITAQAGPGNAFPHNPIYPGTNPDFGDGVGSANSLDFAVCHVTSSTARETVLLNNKSSFPALAQQVYWTIIYLPTG